MRPEVNLVVAAFAVALLFLLFRARHGWFWRWRRWAVDPVRIRVEDALKQLYHCEEEGHPGSVDSLAGALEMRRDAAASLANSMEQRGLICTDCTGLRLTDAGRQYSLQVIRTHRLWEQYLAEETGVDEREWHEQADQIEHQLTPDEADALAARMGDPAFDPHGDPIPTAKGDISVPRGKPLNTVGGECLVRITHVEDEPEIVYRALRAAKLRVGLCLRVLESSVRGVVLQSELGKCRLAPIEAANVTVEVLTDTLVDQMPRVPLSSLAIGQQATVWDISPVCRGVERRRLLDLGLVPGTVVRAELASPARDPIAYLVRGALIALRRQQAEMILVTDPQFADSRQPHETHA